MTNECWIKVWPSPDFEHEPIVLHGPGECPRMAQVVRWPSGGEVHDDIESVVTGPKTWFIGYEDEFYGDTQCKIGPNTVIHNLKEFQNGMQDNIDSYKLFDHCPPEW